MTMRSFALAVLALLALALAPSVARADSPDELRALLERATRLYDLGKYEDAARDFEDLYAQKPDPVILYDIAQCYRMMKIPDKGIFFYKQFLKKMPEAPNRAEVETWITELEELERQQAAPPPPVASPPPVEHVYVPPPPQDHGWTPPPPPPTEAPATPPVEQPKPIVLAPPAPAPAPAPVVVNLPPPQPVPVQRIVETPPPGPPPPPAEHASRWWVGVLVTVVLVGGAAGAAVYFLKPGAPQFNANLGDAGPGKAGFTF